MPFLLITPPSTALRLLTLLTITSLPLALPSSGAVRLNEWLAFNQTGIADKDGDQSDWIELHNDGDSSIDLTGWHLTDDPDNLIKWRLPKGSVPPHGYLLIHASGKDFSSLFNPEIHTSFSLSTEGEYLALVEPDGLTVADAVEPVYPPQQPDVSYGRTENQALAYFAQPTPGEANGIPSAGLVEEVRFNVKRGYYDEPVTLELSSKTPGATIRYTVNGRVPSLFTSSPYETPITIDKTTTIRAHALKEGWITSPLKTHTYLFVDDVLQQDTLAPSVTEDPVYGPLMEDALKAQPAIMLVTPDTDISKTAEDPVSVEMLFPDGSDGFQIDAGIKRVGGHSLNAYPKNNMRLYFRSQYGEPKLRFPLFKNHPFTDQSADAFDQLNLRSGSHDSVFYLGANNQPPSDAQYLRNRWINDMQFLMGHESVRGRWVHVYINGIYWGHYQIMERPTQDFFASYLGGKKEDYVAINKGQGVGDSDMNAWNAMKAARTNFTEFQRWVDVENYVDYMLLNYYAGNDWDWNPEQNWAGGGPVQPDSGGMKFIAWDSDIIFRRLNDNNLNKPGPHSMFPALMTDPDFAIYVADRIQKHFYNDGMLTPERVAEPYRFRAEQIRLSLIPETARWERGRWTRDQQWQREFDRLTTEFFPKRTAEVLDQFKAKGWTGSVAAPSISPDGGYAPVGVEVKLNKSIFARGTIVYTLDGSDPRLPGGTLSPTAHNYQSGITLNEPTTIKARVTNSDGWSALVEERFAVGLVAPTPETITISKLNYRPAAPSPDEIAAGFADRSDFEFIELLNLGDTSLDLHGLRFQDGISYTFSEASAISALPPGQSLFLVKNDEAFRNRYGASPTVAGTFTGSLSNDGETLKLGGPGDITLQDLTYNDVAPWPLEADGDGAYLILRAREKARPDDPGQWRASLPSESPADPLDGQSPETSAYTDWALSMFPDNESQRNPEADADHDGYANLLEFALDTLPHQAASHPFIGVSHDSDGRPIMTTHQRTALGEVELHLEHSRDLQSWQAVPQGGILHQQPLAGRPSTQEVTYDLGIDPAQTYFRLRATLTVR